MASDALTDGRWHPASIAAWPKPLPTEPPLHALDPRFVARKNALNMASVTLKNGQEIGYFEEGDKNSKTIVLAIGGSPPANSGMFIFEEPLANVRLIAISRPGTGLGPNLSPAPGATVTDVINNWTIKKEMEVIGAFVEALDLNSFIVIGYSAGGGIAQKLAIMMPSRVRAIGCICGITDLNHSQITEREKKEVMSTDSAQKMAVMMHAGCLSGLLRFCLSGILKKVNGPRGGPPTEAVSGLLENMEKPVPARIQAAKTDPFWASSAADMLYGLSNSCVLIDIKDRAVPWEQFGFDIAKITCPVQLHCGSLDTIAPPIHAKIVARLAPRAKVIVHDGETHTSLTQPSRLKQIFETIIASASYTSAL